jgi:hypothetical protein
MTGIRYQIAYDSFDDISLLQDILPFFTDFETIPFEVSKEHSLINAYWVSELCRLAYLTSQTRIIKECAKVNLRAKVFWWNNTEFLVAHDNEKIFIISRGTETSQITDAVTDISCMRTKLGNKGDVHAGFLNALSLICDDMFAYIKSIYTNQFIVYGGHSLGAGLASICAALLDGDVLYTFGSPRTGNAKFSLYMNMRIQHYRYVNAGDPVPALPPPIIGWRHFGHMMLITSDSFIRDANPVKGLGEFLKKKVWARLVMILTLGKWVLMDFVAEHNIISYNQWLREQVDLPPLEIPQEYLDQVGK